jgi:hypothetical protein
MTDSTSDTTELASHYIAQVTGDLERNVKEQERIGTEIAALEEQLAVLRRDHAVLLSMQQALGATTPVAPAAPATAVSVPTPREETPVRPRRARKAAPQANKKAPAARKAPTTRPAADKGKSTGKAKATSKVTDKTMVTAKDTVKDTVKGKSSARPTLVELVQGHLAEQNEPRSAAEVASALGAAHPERDIKANVVRTTLEGLVAKNRAQRSKQGSSVFYTAAGTADNAADTAAHTAADTTGAPGTAEAPAAPETSD